MAARVSSRRSTRISKEALSRFTVDVKRSEPLTELIQDRGNAMQGLLGLTGQLSFQFISLHQKRAKRLTLHTGPRWYYIPREALRHTATARLANSFETQSCSQFQHRIPHHSGYAHEQTNGYACTAVE